MAAGNITHPIVAMRLMEIEALPIGLAAEPKATGDPAQVISQDKAWVVIARALDKAWVAIVPAVDRELPVTDRVAARAIARAAGPVLGRVALAGQDPAQCLRIAPEETELAIAPSLQVHAVAAPLAVGVAVATAAEPRE